VRLATMLFRLSYTYGSGDAMHPETLHYKI
jgi:hypothetical protein